MTPLDSPSPLVWPVAASLSHPYWVGHHTASHLRCRYRSKICTSQRAHKRNGELHRYCEYHRQRANSNQKKWASRRMRAADANELHTLELVCQHGHVYHQYTREHLASDPTVELPLRFREASGVAAIFEEDEDVWHALGLNELMDEIDLKASE